MSSLQSTPLVLANAEAAAPAQPAATQTVATTAAPAKRDGGFSAKPTAGELVEFQLTGLLVVFVVLGAITAISALMSWMLKTFLPSQYYGKTTPAPAAKAAPAAPAAKAAPVGAATATPSGLTQEKLLVILTAAAHEVLGVPVSVVSFRPVGSADALWTVQGRATHHSSHKL